MLYRIGRAAVRLFLFFFTRFEVTGRENVPKRGGLLVSANHLSYMDPPVVGAVLARSPVFMAKEELFRSPLFGTLISMLGAFPVHRGRLDREAMRRAERALCRGKALVMFPEGARRGQDTYQSEGYMGAALLAIRSEVPVLPVGITGTESIKGLGWMLHRPKITVNIGVPFSLTRANGSRRRALLTEYTGQIMGRIADLLPAGYRGHGEG